MSSMMGGSAQGAGKMIRPGATFWTTFRLLADVVYGVCVLIALPIELLLNRRMGRRYSNFFALTVSMLMVFGLYGYLGWALPYARELLATQRVNAATAPGSTSQITSRGWLTPSPPPSQNIAPIPMPLISGQRYFLPCLLVVFGVALIAHRLDNWWRFRTIEQVHSRSCGIPHWVWWLWRAMGKRSQTPSTLATEIIEAKPAESQAIAQAAPPSFTRELWSSVRSFLRSAITGVPPSGPLAWLASTVVHPILIWLAGVLIASVDPVIAVHLVVVAWAILIKARIEKAIVIETIYDVFDARIEQVFMRGLESPQELESARRAGMVVPGVAEAMPQAFSRLPKQSALSPEYQALVTALRDEKPDQPQA